MYKRQQTYNNSVIFIVPLLLGIIACSGLDLGLLGRGSNDNNQIEAVDFVFSSGLQNDNSCRSPCWFGIQPGITDFNQTMEIVSTITKLGSVSVFSDTKRIELGEFLGG